MPRTLSARTTTEVEKEIGAKPLYLVYLGYDTPLRKSSGPTLTWDGETWTADDMIVSVTPGKNVASLQMQNTDYVFGGIVLTTKLIDKVVKIYQLYGDTPYDVADAELLFDGVGGACQVGLRWVTPSLHEGSTKIMYCPRIRCTKEIGFNHLPPDGLVISWDAETYTLPSDNQDGVTNPNWVVR